MYVIRDSDKIGVEPESPFVGIEENLAMFEIVSFSIIDKIFIYACITNNNDKYWFDQLSQNFL